VASDDDVAQARVPLPRPRPQSFPGSPPPRDEDFTDTGVEKRFPSRPYDPPLSPEDSQRIRDLIHRDATGEGQGWYERLHNYLGPDPLSMPSPPQIANDLARHFFGKLFFPLERHEESMNENLGRQLRGEKR